MLLVIKPGMATKLVKILIKILGNKDALLNVKDVADDDKII